jgi:hypothetical protein
MAQFKVDQRVRIVYRGKYFGKEGVVWKVGRWKSIDPPVIDGSVKVGETLYNVDVDSIGRYESSNYLLGYRECDLAPLTNPDADAWQEFKAKFLQPDISTTGIPDYVVKRETEKVMK